VGREKARFQNLREIWDTIGHAVIDSIETPAEPMWIRNPGFKEAWEKIPLREEASL
jgi:hypothetical protein